MLDHIRFVLCNTTHPGNIGAAARAMKTMAVSRLTLVSPRHFPDAEATARASGADDLLQNATVTDDLEAAVADCHLVLGSSARLRKVALAQYNAREAAEVSVARAAAGQQVAVLFGTERSGLSNDEINRCHALVHIPSNPDYSSLNLGSAVQVLAYEFQMAMLNQAGLEPNRMPDHVPATQDQFQGLMGHFEQAMTVLKILNPKQSATLMARIQRLMSRAEPSDVEINILRGLLSAAEKAAQKSTQKSDTTPAGEVVGPDR